MMTLNLKLNRPHPKNAFRIQDIVVVGYSYQEYEITEENAKAVVDELRSESGRAWIACKELIEDEAEESEEGTFDPNQNSDLDLGAPVEDVVVTAPDTDEVYNVEAPAQDLAYDPGNQKPEVEAPVEEKKKKKH